MTMNFRFRKSSEAELPDNLTFAIVLRENDELIGRNESFLDMVHRSAETGTESSNPNTGAKAMAPKPSTCCSATRSTS